MALDQLNVWSIHFDSDTIPLVFNHNHDIVVRRQVPLHPVCNPFVTARVEDILGKIGELVTRHLEIVGALVAPLDGARVDAIDGSTVLTIASAMITALDVVCSWMPVRLVGRGEARFEED